MCAAGKSLHVTLHLCHVTRVWFDQPCYTSCCLYLGVSGGGDLQADHTEQSESGQEGVWGPNTMDHYTAGLH